MSITLIIIAVFTGLTFITNLFNSFFLLASLSDEEPPIDPNILKTMYI